jgi:hypothetical protein
VAASPRTGWVRQHFAEYVRAADEDRAYGARGTMTEDLQQRADPAQYYGLTVEFGTLSSVRILGALRAENRGHFYSSVEDAAFGRAKRHLAGAFAPPSTAWRTQVVRTGVELVQRAIAAAAS